MSAWWLRSSSCSSVRQPWSARQDPGTKSAPGSGSGPVGRIAGSTPTTNSTCSIPTSADPSSPIRSDPRVARRTFGARGVRTPPPGACLVPHFTPIKHRGSSGEDEHRRVHSLTCLDRSGAISMINEDPRVGNDCYSAGSGFESLMAHIIAGHRISFEQCVCMHPHLTPTLRLQQRARSHRRGISEAFRWVEIYTNHVAQPGICCDEVPAQCERSRARFRQVRGSDHGKRRERQAHHHRSSRRYFEQPDHRENGTTARVRPTRRTAPTPALTDLEARQTWILR